MSWTLTFPRGWIEFHTGQKRELDIARLTVVAMCADKYIGIS